jgi:hypothetical protein
MGYFYVELPEWAAYAAVALVLLILGWLLGPLRQRAWRRLAAELGLRYSPRPRPDLLSDLPFDELRRRGRSRLYNVAAGHYRGREICCFDLDSEEARDGRDEVISRTYVLVRAPVALPKLALEPVGSGRYRAVCDDSAFMRRWLDRRGQALLACTDSLHIEGRQDLVLVRADGDGWLDVATEVRPLLTIALDLVDLIPTEW